MTIQEMNERRKELGYSYEKLSELSGVPVGTVQKVLGGITKSPRYDTVWALEKVLDPYKPSMVRETVAVYGEKRPGEYTIEDYYRFSEEKRCELIDGVIYDMATPTVIHQLICAQIWRVFDDYIKKNKGECIPIMSPTSVQLDCDDKTMLIPDIIINCKRDKFSKHGISGAPELVVEILLPSTSRIDKTIKLDKYTSAGVREYWIVDPKKKCIVAYTEDGEGDYDIALYSFQDKVPVFIFHNDCKVDFQEIYDYVAFMYEKEDEK